MKKRLFFILFTILALSTIGLTAVHGAFLVLDSSSEDDLNFSKGIEQSVLGQARSELEDVGAVDELSSEIDNMVINEEPKEKIYLVRQPYMMENHSLKYIAIIAIMILFVWQRKRILPEGFEEKQKEKIVRMIKKL